MIFPVVLGWTLVTIVIISIAFGLFCWFSKKFFFHNKLDDIDINKPNLWIGLLLILAILLVFFAFTAPVLFTNSSSYGDFNASTGAVGDTIGGIMNPFIALAAVIVTGLAFYMQFQANKQVQDQFKLQQFDYQFYEMLRLHKENVNEMEIEGYEYDSSNNKKEFKVTKGRKVFVTMIRELECIYLIIKKCYKLKIDDLKEHSITHYDIKSEINNKIFSKKTYYSFPDNEKYFYLAYEIFFHGLDKFEEAYYDNIYHDYNNIFILELINELKRCRKSHSLGGKKQSNYLNIKGSPFIEKELFKEYIDKKFPSLKMYFNYKPFSGHQRRLGHYYRHLISITGFVVKSDLLVYEQKREYLKLLRGQLSNHEFVLLYYNFLSGYGSKWENQINSYLIDYRMLHNIQRELVLPEFNPYDKMLSIKYSFLYKNDDVNDDSLFELYKTASKLSIEDNRKLKNK
ncbi:putative phage abortive infection protein [Sphingobacterium composti Ten et al. 2007 non Yoo et al. 2007]|uniref:putative phage abortive infection protein n=1 Tax=Sphingobacterium composti TaxID=363260 RepID=UPI00135C83B9|nr:putative phage abortive infection protein [Sphingobacterium composti Ten et al. 2007 non Yoo et al. 2007]